MEVSNRSETANEERLRLALEASNIGGWDCNLQTNELVWFGTHEAVFGLEPGTFDGSLQTFYNCMHPDDREKVRQLIANTAGSNAPFSYEYRVIWPKDNSVHWIESRGRFFYDELGQPSRFVGTCSEITDRKRLEEATRKSEAELQQILDNSTAVIYARDREGRVLRINRQCEERYGLDREKAKGRSIYELYPKEIAEAWLENDRRVLDTGRVWEAEEASIYSDGLRHTHFSIKFPLFDSEGQPYAVCGMSTDITARKRLEEAQRFLAQASSILATSLDVDEIISKVTKIVVPTLADYCILDLVENEITAQTDIADIRLKQQEVRHQDATKETTLRRFVEKYRFDPNHPSGTARLFLTQQIEFHPEILTAEVEDFTADATELSQLVRELNPRSYIGIPLVARGQVVGALSLVRSDSQLRYDPFDLEIAEELGRRIAQSLDNARLYRQVQEALQAQQKTDKLKDQFISIASHELRTPLTSIRGFAQMLQRSMRKELSTLPTPETNPNLDKQLRSLDTILHQSARMSELINRLLDFSRLQEGRLELNYSSIPVNLNQLIERVIELQRVASDQHELVFVEPSADLQVYCDEARLEQVLNNFVTNAFKYSPAGSKVEVSLKQSEQEAIIWVKDEGYGISSEHLPRLFEKFYRVRDEQTQVVDGLGLGLYISYEIIMQHKGRMWVESQPGQGSTFYFSLPLTAS